MWMTSALLASAGFFLFSLSCVLYVAFRFLILVLSLDSAILREFKGQIGRVDQVTAQGPINEKKLKDFIQSRMAPTEGDYHPYSDEEAFIQEKVEELRHQGMTQEELDAFVRQAVGSDIGSPEQNG